jgi:hypothetical protein
MTIWLLWLWAAWRMGYAQVADCRPVRPGWALAVGEARYEPWLDCSKVWVLQAAATRDVLRDLLALGQHAGYAELAGKTTVVWTAREVTAPAWPARLQLAVELAGDVRQARAACLVLAERGLAQAGLRRELEPTDGRTATASLWTRQTQLAEVVAVWMQGRARCGLSLAVADSDEARRLALGRIAATLADQRPSLAETRPVQ